MEEMASSSSSRALCSAIMQGLKVVVMSTQVVSTYRGFGIWLAAADIACRSCFRCCEACTPPHGHQAGVRRLQQLGQPAVVPSQVHGAIERKVRVEHLVWRKLNCGSGGCFAGRRHHHTSCNGERAQATPLERIYGATTLGEHVQCTRLWGF